MESGDAAATPDGAAGFGAISPLEPLDPTKFRNIMVEKQGPGNSQQRNETPVIQQRPLSAAEGRPGTSMQHSMTIESKQTESDLGQQQQQPISSDRSGPFVQPRFTLTPTSFPHNQPPPNMQQQMKMQQQQQLPPSPQQPQQQQYFIHQNPPHHPYGTPQPSPSTALHSPVHQYGYMVQGPSQPGWNQQLPGPPPQYLNAHHGQMRMASPQHQQQMVLAKQQFPGNGQVPPYATTDGGQLIAYPPAHPLHQNVSPTANMKKHEFQQQQQQHYQQQIMAQQQQQQQHVQRAVLYPHLQYPSPAGFPMAGPGAAMVDPRQYMSPSVQQTPSTPHSALPGSSPVDLMHQQNAGGQIKKAQSMILHSSPEQIQQQPVPMTANPAIAANFSSPPSSQYIRPPSAQDFNGVQQPLKQPMVRLPVHGQQHQLHQMAPQPQFVGHEPQLAATLNPDICLAGCVFLLIDDCDPQLVESSLLPNIIRFYGGDTESNNPRGIPERVTHIVCSSWIENEALIQQALGFVDRIPRKMKRVVTLNWLNDAIEKRQVLPPTKAHHLPSVWSPLRHNPQTFAKTISAIGFNQRDLLALKYMVQMIGARFSAEIEPKTDFILTTRNSLNEELCQKVIEAEAVLVNYQWLVELYFGNLAVLSSANHPRYSPHNESAQLTVSACSPHALAKVSELCHKFMLPWCQSPIPLNEEIIRSAHVLKENVKGDMSIFPEKQYKIEDNCPTEEQIEKANSLYAKAPQHHQKCLVLIEGLFPEQIENLSKKVRFLGGKMAESVTECTHFVTTSLHRTSQLLEAIATGKNVVTPLWVETSYRQLEFVDELSFFVRDRENEKKHGFSLKATILRARHRRIFEGVKFHLSPGVQPDYGVIKRLVEAAGGTVQAQKPTGAQLVKCIQNNDIFFVICDRNNLNSYQYLMKCNFPILNEDFVLMAILRHKIDLSEEFHAYPSQPLPIPTKS